MMLKCTIELIPFGDVTQIETLATVMVCNDKTGSHNLGNYNIYLDEKGKKYTGRVENHPRLQHGPAFLVARAIDACLKSE